VSDDSSTEVYLLYIWIRQISPLIWRRLLVRSDSTLADLHHAIQIAFSWTDFHLHRFHIHGQDYGINRTGGLFFSADARDLHLSQFGFRRNERFLYEYDFGDLWQHEVRVEQTLPIDAKKTYPVCTDGQRAAPPEDCGEPLVFIERRERVPWEIDEQLWQILEGVRKGDVVAARDRLEVILPLREWLRLDQFDRRAVNRRLKQYATGDEHSLDE